MERVLGIGGYFMRAADPAALSASSRKVLDLPAPNEPALETRVTRNE